MAHLPGQTMSVQEDEWGTDCENHSDRKAVKRICSEADSFGAEYMNFCQECWDNYQQGLKEKEEDPEQWDTCPECKKKAPRLISYRDMDEGMHGPVYEHCEECHSKMNARIAEEEAHYNDDDDYDPGPDCDYGPEPHYSDVVESELQVLIDYLKSEYNLPFVIKKTTSKKTGKEELSIILEVADGRAFKRINKCFDSFKYIDLANNLINVNSLKEAMCGTADDIEVTILNRRISDRKIEGSKRTPALSIGELIQLARDKKRVKRKVAKEFITPVYAIEIILAKVYW
jgi:hypothetical protein